MLAIEIINQQLHDTIRPIPVITKDEVLIQVKAAGINRPDIMQCKGLYPPPPGASDILGLEVSGIVIEAGKNVSQINTGDKVCALVTGGAYAEYCSANASLCLPIPNNYTFSQAAALPETFFTVWSNIFNTARLRRNENLLIHGGSSGIGTTAIQLCKAFGANVFVTAGTDAKCQFCRDIGADFAINYNQQDFVAEIMDITNDKGVNVILDIIAGDYFDRNLKCLDQEGRLVQIAVQNGPTVKANILPIMLKRLTVTGTTLRNRDIIFKSRIASQLLEQVWPMLESGKILPIIDRTFPLTEAKKAHQLMESSKHSGKIILMVSE